MSRVYRAGIEQGRPGTIGINNPAGLRHAEGTVAIWKGLHDRTSKKFKIKIGDIGQAIS
jgi:hypothetical protein